MTFTGPEIIQSAFLVVPFLNPFNLSVFIYKMVGKMSLWCHREDWEFKQWIINVTECWILKRKIPLFPSNPRWPLPTAEVLSSYVQIRDLTSGDHQCNSNLAGFFLPRNKRYKQGLISSQETYFVLNLNEKRFKNKSTSNLFKIHYDVRSPFSI